MGNQPTHAKIKTVSIKCTKCEGSVLVAARPGDQHTKCVQCGQRLEVCLDAGDIAALPMGHTAETPANNTSGKKPVYRKPIIAGSAIAIGLIGIGVVLYANHRSPTETAEPPQPQSAIPVAAPNQTSVIIQPKSLQEQNKVSPPDDHFIGRFFLNGVKGNASFVVTPTTIRQSSDAELTITEVKSWLTGRRLFNRITGEGPFNIKACYEFSVDLDAPAAEHDQVVIWLVSLSVNDGTMVGEPMVVHYTRLPLAK